MRSLRDESGQSAGPRAGFARQQFKDRLLAGATGVYGSHIRRSYSTADLLDAEVPTFLLIRSRSFPQAEFHADRVSK
jgi:hypothetical protein